MKNHFTHVYIAKMPEEVGNASEIYPEFRKEYIESAKHCEVRRSRFYVWRLLEAALRKSLGIDIKNLAFSVDSGRWSTPECNFSLSHGGGYIAVALSSEPVGVDIEPISERRSERFAERILSEEELKEYKNTPTDMRKDYLISAWTKKEAIFKSLNKDAFIPQKIDTGSYLCEERILSYPSTKLMLAIAHAGKAPFEIYEDTEI